MREHCREIAREVPLTSKMLDAFGIETQIKRLKQSQERLRARQTRTTSTWHSVVIKGGANGDFAEIQADIEEQNAAIQELVRRYNATMREIDTHPDADVLSNDEFFALKYIYAYGCTIEKAALELKASQSSVWRWQTAAFKKLRKGAFVDGE